MRHLGDNRLDDVRGQPLGGTVFAFMPGFQNTALE